MRNSLIALISVIIASFTIMTNNCFSQQYVETPNHTMISIPLPSYDAITIIDTTPASFYNSPWRPWGYPGIFIEGYNFESPKITFNEKLRDFISAEVVDNELIVRLDVSFLNPLTGIWEHAWGMIDAISIMFPKKGVKYIKNYGGYNFNISLQNVNQKNLELFSNNTTYIRYCNIKNLYCAPAQNISRLADRCEYNIGLTYSSVGTLHLNKDYAANFLIDSSSSYIRNTKYDK